MTLLSPRFNPDLMHTLDIVVRREMRQAVESFPPKSGPGRMSLLHESLDSHDLGISLRLHVISPECSPESNASLLQQVSPHLIRVLHDEQKRFQIERTHVFHLHESGAPKRPFPYMSHSMTSSYSMSARIPSGISTATPSG